MTPAAEASGGTCARISLKQPFDGSFGKEFIRCARWLCQYLEQKPHHCRPSLELALLMDVDINQAADRSIRPHAGSFVIIGDLIGLCRRSLVHGRELIEGDRGGNRQ
jgi:hypothetical protein